MDVGWRGCNVRSPAVPRHAPRPGHYRDRTTPPTTFNRYAIATERTRDGERSSSYAELSSMHSIIIAHRNRNRNLEFCLWSLAHSNHRCGISDYEILVVDGGSLEVPAKRSHVRILEEPLPPTLFNKSRLLNRGIEEARGDILSFLDADIIVGPCWLANVKKLDDPKLIRLCYRYRWIQEDDLYAIEDLTTRAEVLDEWFRHYNDRHYTRRFFRRAECYYRADHSIPEGREPSPVGSHVFGASQFSIRREDLGDLRYAEDELPLLAWEDIDMNDQIACKFGDRYFCEIVTDGPHALLDIQSVRGPDGKDEGNTQQEIYWRRHRARRKGDSTPKWTLDRKT